MKILHSITLVLLILSLCGCNNEIEEIKGMIDYLEAVNQEVITLVSDGHSQNFIELIKEGKNENVAYKLNQLIVQNELCEIQYYYDLGVTYLFRCKNDSRDNFVDGDVEYYLIKVFYKENWNKFQHYAQFADYRTELKELRNNWYFNKKVIFYD